MAEGYSGITNGYMFAAQANLGMAQTLRLTMRMPSVANRIFDTKQHAQDFIDDISTKASAIKGLILSSSALSLIPQKYCISVLSPSGII